MGWNPFSSGGALAMFNPAAAIGTAASIGGDILAYKGQKDTNEQNLAIARENMDFQERMANTAMDFSERMSNTAYQRSMEDMAEAGLNPILAYQQGGASTPVGQSAGGAMATMQNPSAVFSNTGQNVMSAMNTGSTILTQAQNRENLRSQLENDKYFRSLNDQQQTKVFQEAEKIQAETAGIEAENVQRQILADFYDSANFMKIAKEIGINPQMLKAIFVGIFGSKGRR